MRIDKNGILFIDCAGLDACNITWSNIKQLKARGQVKATTAHRGQAAEVQYESLPERFKDKVVAVYGCPYEYVRTAELEARLKEDESALEFYHGYKSGGQYLPENEIERCLNAAKWLNYINELDLMGKRGMKLLGVDTKEEFWAAVTDQLIKAKAPVPKNYSNLRRKLKKYLGTGKNRNYKSLISGKVGNTNTAKISDTGKQWMIAQYSLPIKLTPQDVWMRYNLEAEARNWKPLEDARTVQYMLNRADVRREWYGPRNGWRKATQEYGYTLSTSAPSYRDALWEGDGTKLNFYFVQDGKMVANYNVYLVIDAYSEAVIGYDIAPTENWDNMYHAYRMAVETTGAKPYELKFDNQGGHKKLMPWFDKLARLAATTQPYNAKSKLIESVIGRMQQGPMRKYWFFTGQNIQTKKEDSKPNIEFILENKASLPNLEEVKVAFAECVEVWNSDRMPIYMASKNPEPREVSYIDMIELFWVETEKTITYHASGLKLTHRNRDYWYEVMEDGEPNEAFLAEFTKAKFKVKYDPKDMSHCRLYAETPSGLRYVAAAETKAMIPRAKQEQEPGDRANIDSLLEVRRRQVEQMKNSAKLRGLDTGVNAKSLVKAQSYGQQLKEDSYEDHADSDMAVIAAPKRKTNLKNIV